MKLDLVFKNYTSQKSPGENFFKKIIEKGASTLKIKGSLEVSVNLIGELKIRELNRKFLKKNKTTDVLSFPLKESGLKKYGILPLGDIFICLPLSKKEAFREKISLRTKLGRLTIHGFLHLLGFDHENSEKKAEEMFKLEDRIFSKL